MRGILAQALIQLFTRRIALGVLHDRKFGPVRFEVLLVDWVPAIVRLLERRTGRGVVSAEIGRKKRSIGSIITAFRACLSKLLEKRVTGCDRLILS